MTSESGDDGDPAEAPDPDGLDERLDELRDAAGAVLSSLKRLVDAAEGVVEDPRAFDRFVRGGRGIVESFTEGFHDDGSGAGPRASEGDESP